MLSLMGVEKRLGKFRLSEVSFNVGKGEIVGFVGLNGAGKTTTIRIAAGVLEPDAGEVMVEGHSMRREKREASKYLGWVPELPTFEQDAKALDYFVYLAGFYGLKAGEAKVKGEELFRELDLQGQERKRLRDFSQGMKKRFALAVSMISDPPNFLFDEVLNGLDPQGIAYFREICHKFRKEGKAVLFSSHILAEVENLADRVILIHGGRIVKELKAEEVRSTSTAALRIGLDRVDQGALQLASSFGEPRVEGGYLILENLRAKPEEVSQAFVEAGYRITEMNRVSGNLEDVFFRLIGLRK